MHAMKPMAGNQDPSETICVTLTPTADTKSMPVSVKYTCVIKCNTALGNMASAVQTNMHELKCAGSTVCRQVLEGDNGNPCLPFASEPGHEEICRQQTVSRAAMTDRCKSSIQQRCDHTCQ